MKTRIVLITMFILAIIGSFVNAEAGEYIGDYCWQDQDGEIFRLGFTHMGGGHYSVNGQLIPTNPEPGEGPYGLHGGMEVINGEIHINLTSEADYGPTEAGMITLFMRLNPATLNGSYKGVEIWSDVTNTDQGMECFSGTLSPVSCQ